MDDNKETIWSAFWGLLIFSTLFAVPLAAQESGWAGGGGMLVILVFEVCMLGLPSFLDEWAKDAPQRQRARALARRRANERARLRAEQDDVRRQQQAERARQRAEKAALAKARREVADARHAAEFYYQTNAALLKDVLPPALFRAEIEAAFVVGISPADAWQTARDLIERLLEIVQEEKVKQQKRAEELATIDAAIRKTQERISQLRSSTADPDMIDDEVFGLKQEVQRLTERRAALASTRSRT